MREYDHLSTADLLDAALAEAHRDSSDDNDELYRRVWALTDRATGEVFDAAAAWCRGESATEKRLGTSILSKFWLGGSLTEPQWAESLEIVRSLLEDHRPSVIAAAVRAFDFQGSEHDARRIIQHGNHPAIEVRLAVAQTLPCGEACAEEVETLIRLSSDDDSTVRAWATSSLRSWCDADSPPIRDALLERLGDSDWDARSEAITGLAEWGDRRVLGALIAELYSDEVCPLRIDDAAELGAPELLPALWRVRKDFGPNQLLDEAIRKCGGDPTET